MRPDYHYENRPARRGGSRFHCYRRLVPWTPPGHEQRLLRIRARWRWWCYRIDVRGSVSLLSPLRILGTFTMAPRRARQGLPVAFQSPAHSPTRGRPSLFCLPFVTNRESPPQSFGRSEDAALDAAVLDRPHPVREPQDSSTARVQARRIDVSSRRPNATCRRDRSTTRPQITSRTHDLHSGDLGSIVSNSP